MRKSAIFLLLLLIICLKPLAQPVWSQLANFPGVERDDGIAFVINNKAYIGSGLREWALTGDFYSLDLATETWTAAASLPMWEERQYACGFTDGINGYVFGGTGIGGDLNTLWMYSPSTNSWTAKASKPGNGVRGASCFVIGNIAYIVGGAFSTNDAINEVWAYDITANTWTQKNNLPVTNWRGSATSANGKGYLLYGMNSAYAYSRYLYEYDPAGDNWTYKSTFAGPGTGKVYANMQAINDDLVVFAGKDSLNACNNQLWTYNLTSNFWLSVSTLTATLRKGGMGFTHAGAYYYTCGISQADVRLKETWKINVAVGVNEIESKEQLIAYPNPASDFITINHSKSILKNSAYRIINMQGSVIVDGVINESQQISLVALNPGVYQLLIGTLSSRIIVQ